MKSQQAARLIRNGFRNLLSSRCTNCNKFTLPAPVMSIRKFGYEDDFGLMKLHPWWSMPESKFGNTWNDSAFNPAKGFSIDIVDKSDKYRIEADLPGLNKSEIQVTVNDGMLNIEVERSESNKTEEEEEEGKYVRQERSFGRLCRSFQLPKDCLTNAESMSANYQNGVLTVEVPKSKDAKKSPHQIPVN